LTRTRPGENKADAEKEKGTHRGTHLFLAGTLASVAALLPNSCLIAARRCYNAGLMNAG
jgi:hypothetical protein